MVTYHCPHCNELLRVADERAGQAFVCGLCGKSSLPPTMAEELRKALDPPTLLPVRRQAERPIAIPTPPPPPPPPAGPTPEQRASRIERLFQIEAQRPLSHAEWIEASEHYRALGQPDLAAEADRRAATAAPAPQVVVNTQQNVTMPPAAPAPVQTDRSAEAILGCLLLFFFFLLAPVAPFIIVPLGLVGAVIGLIILGRR